MIRRRDCSQKLGLADTEFARLQFRLEMGCYVADKGYVTDRQHKCQNDYPYPNRLVHTHILNQIFRIDASDPYFD